jgi:hypothetical protein
MKIDRKKRVIRLGAADTKKWEHSGSAGYDFRRNVRDIACGMVRASGKSVEIYASETAGGWMADQITPESCDVERAPS